MRVHAGGAVTLRGLELGSNIYTIQRPYGDSAELT